MMRGRNDGRRIDPICVAPLVILALACGCAASPEAGLPARDGRYDSHFPRHDAAPFLQRISTSVQMVTAIAYYKVSLIPERDSLQAGMVFPGALEPYAEGARYINSMNAGATTILSLGTGEALALTCAHVVSFPETVVSYHHTAAGRRTSLLSSVALLARRSITIAAFPEGGEFEVIAADSDEDIALLGKHFAGDLIAPVTCLPYPVGTTADLDWGTFVYVMGYPRGHQMLTHGLVSLARRPAKEGFLIDAGMGRGFSGGPILAVRDGLPHLEWVGMARMMPGQTSYVLAPEFSEGELDYDPTVPYHGDAFVRRQTEIHYGMVRAIGAETILAFLERCREVISACGYAPLSFPVVPTPRPPD